MSRVLVTGGAGYVGSAVVERLVAARHEVCVFDDISTGHRDSIPEGVQLYEGDVSSDRFADALEACRAEAVVHMAARSIVGESVEAPGEYYRANVSGGIAVLEAMRRQKVRHLILSSSAAVYGEPLKQPVEEGDPTEPTSPYGETKLVLERALPWYERTHGLRWTALRYFNAAGSTSGSRERHDPETHLIPRVLRAACEGSPFPVFGIDYPTPDGSCVRDYVHVEDLARAHEMALGRLYSGGPSRVYNLGSGRPGSSVLEVIEAAGRVVGRPIQAIPRPRRHGDPAVLVASAERARREMGWTPTRTLEEIVSSAWDGRLRPADLTLSPGRA